MLVPAHQSVARTFVVPHFIEQPGTIANTQYTFDTGFQAVYTPGLIDGETVTSATVRLYLFNNAGSPIMSQTANPVCNPCTFVLNSATRRVADTFDALIVAAGGFPGGVVTGFALFEVSGDAQHVALSAHTNNAHTSPFDLDFFFHEVPELPAGLNNGLRLMVFPHFVESSLSIVNANSFDTSFYALYGGGVGGSSIPAGTGATVSLYLFNADGTLKKSVTLQNVCAPCTANINSGSPKATYSLQNLFTAAGGFAAGVETGFALVAIQGTANAVAVDGYLANSHTNPFDLAIAELEPREVPTSTPPTSVEAPSLGNLLRTSPNPLQTTTRIDYVIPEAGDASVEIVDVRGTIVARPVGRYHAAGAHVVNWDGRGDDGAELPSGVYFARLVAGSHVQTLKLTMVR
jgi:hypothetical protein